MKCRPLFFLLVLFTSCKTLYRYDYKTSVRDATPDNKMTYENDSLRISFFIEPKYIAFRLDNKLPSPLYVNWDDAVVMIDKEHHKVMRTDMGMFREYERQAPTVISPGSYTRSQFVPVRNLKVEEIGEATVLNVTPFLPAQDKGDKILAAKIHGMKGSVMELQFPLHANGKNFTKTFYITIDTVIATKTGSRLFLQKNQHPK
ncbi:MAG TPA: hypothetical protein VMR70_19175 [Flavisolibacter sp.]|nr:hypothetical protein [Flavisolibacter sp.]